MLFTYWEGDQFSYFHYLTILSLYKLNPGKEITVYTSTSPQKDLKITWKGNEHKKIITKTVSFSEILPMVTLVDVDFEKTYGITNNLSVVHKGDCIRILKLYEHGGVWFDMDILFVKPLPNYILDPPYQCMTHSYHGTVATGIITCQKGSTIAALCRDNLFEKIKNKGEIVDYQWLGCDLWKEVAQTCGICIMDTHDVYPYLYNNLGELYFSDRDVLTENTYAIHWYNGAPLTRLAINNFDINENYVFNKYVRLIL